MKLHEGTTCNPQSTRLRLQIQCVRMMAPCVKQWISRWDERGEIPTLDCSQTRACCRLHVTLIGVPHDFVQASSSSRFPVRDRKGTPFYSVDDTGWMLERLVHEVTKGITSELTLQDYHRDPADGRDIEQLSHTEISSKSMGFTPLQTLPTHHM